MTSAPTGITACVIARDEAENLAELLPTLRWADEILVLVDDATGDDSEAVARPLADRVERRAFTSFPAFRNVALGIARHPWVFFVDADERASTELAEEVKATAMASATAAGSDAPVGYWVPRHNIIFGRLVRGGGLLHLNYASPRDFLQRQQRYTALEAASLCAEGQSYRARALLGQPLREFARRYFQLGGWKDGPVGLLLSLALAYFAFRRVQLVRSGSPP